MQVGCHSNILGAVASTGVKKDLVSALSCVGQLPKHLALKEKCITVGSRSRHDKNCGMLRCRSLRGHFVLAQCVLTQVLSVLGSSPLKTMWRHDEC